MQQKLNLTQRFVDKLGKLYKIKTSSGDFKVTTSKNPLINNQVVISIRNRTNYPWPILKYQPTIKPLPQYPIGLDLVVAFILFDAQTSSL